MAQVLRPPRREGNGKRKEERGYKHTDRANHTCKNVNYAIDVPWQFCCKD